MSRRIWHNKQYRKLSCTSLTRKQSFYSILDSIAVLKVFPARAEQQQKTAKRQSHYTRHVVCEVCYQTWLHFDAALDSSLFELGRNRIVSNSNVWMKHFLSLSIPFDSSHLSIERLLCDWERKFLNKNSIIKTCFLFFSGALWVWLSNWKKDFVTQLQLFSTLRVVWEK